MNVSSVAVYAMAFGVIMLNTDAHNAQVRYKMTEKQFIENIHYTSGAESIPAEFLIDLYERITSEEIKQTPEESLFPNAIKKGYLYLHTKSGVGGNRWKRSWVVLSDNCLFVLKRAGVCICAAYILTIF
jgi:hypothetical protein